MCDKLGFKYYFKKSYSSLGLFLDMKMFLGSNASGLSPRGFQQAVLAFLDFYPLLLTHSGPLFLVLRSWAV